MQHTIRFIRQRERLRFDTHHVISLSVDVVMMWCSTFQLVNSLYSPYLNKPTRTDSQYVLRLADLCKQQVVPVCRTFRTTMYRY
jgi:hypothetical protein